MKFWYRTRFHWFFAAILVLGATLGICLLQVQQVQPYEGSQVIRSGERCGADLTDCVPVTLPDRVDVPLGEDSLTLRYRFVVTDGIPAQDTPALLIERLRDAFEVRVNGALISPKLYETAHMWNRPQFMMIPDVLLQETRNSIDITLQSFATGPIRLDPFHIGQAYPLSFYNNLLTIHRVGLTRIGLGLSITLFVMFLGLRLFNSAIEGNTLLLVANGSAVVFLSKGSYIYDPLPHTVWTILWVSAVFAYLFAMIRVFGIWTGMRARRTETVFVITAIGGMALHFGLPKHLWPGIETVIALTALAAGFPVIVQLVRNALANKRMKDAILLAIGVASFSIGLLETADLTGILGPNFRGTPQLVPLFGVIAIVTVLMSQLLHSRAEAKALMLQLRAQVRDRTTQLTEKSAQVENLVAERARDLERERIMLDLHDGIGGQLVSMLAYLGRQPDADPIIRDGMENALSDLAIMMDSLESTQSVTSLLGSLRDRIEPMLLKHGITFDWQIQHEPDLHMTGPAMNLSLMRIVQEAITNIIKHAQASQIRVECDTHHIAIIDNGKGFASEPPPDTGRGLKSMRRRAAEIGGTLTVARQGGKTVVRLDW